MKKYHIYGGRPLYGNVDIQGSKNSAVAILMACIAIRGKVLLRRVPDISDVFDCVSILKHMGANVEWCGEGMLSIDCNTISTRDIPSELTEKMRASTYLMGAELNRFGKCRVPSYGGCVLGERPIDLHLYAFSKLGAKLDSNEKSLFFPDGHSDGGEITFNQVTVGGTVNAILASVCANGNTLISNAAKEPHICDLVRFLNKCGADISGIGTEKLLIRGVDKLNGSDFTLSGDMIEAGTYLIIGAATRGIVSVSGIDPSELSSLLNVFQDMSIDTGTGRNVAIANGQRKMQAATVETTAYPGFPTDLHPQLSVLMSVANGKSRIIENVFSGNRFKYTNDLKKMGARVSVTENVLEIEGTRTFSAADTVATDLRGGAALVTAALCANGESTISGVELIERGYSFLPDKLRTLGARISVTEV